MRKLIKILFFMICIIVILGAIGYFAIRVFLTPANLRSVASRMVSETIKQPVEIGSVSLKFGLKTGIEIDDISIPNLKGFSPGPMIQIDKTSLNLKLLPLLQRKVVIGSIELSGMKAKLEKNRNNQLNIMMLVPKETKGTGWSASLSSINISNSHIQYLDATSNQELLINDIKQRIKFKNNTIVFSGQQSLNIVKSSTIPEIVVSVHNEFEYDILKKDINVKKLAIKYGPMYLNIRGTIEEMEKLNLDADLRTDDLSKLSPLIPINSRPQKLQGSIKAVVSARGTTKAPEIKGQSEFRNISAVLKGMNRGIEKINGSLSFDQNSIRNIIIDGQIAKTKFEIQGTVENLKKPLLDLAVKVSGNLQDFESMTDEIKGIRMSGPLDLRLTLKGETNHPLYLGNFSVVDGQIEGIGLAKPLNDFRIKGDIRNDAVNISECRGKIGRSDFSFDGHIANLKKPVIEINNKSNNIDLDELLPKPTKEKEDASQPFPLTLRGKVQINKMTGIDMEFKNVKADFSYGNGVVDVKNAVADAFDGQVQLDLYYNSNSPEPYRTTTRMTSVSSKKVLKRFLKFENLEGQMTGMSNFQGRGFSQKEVISTLSASGNLKLNNGTFKNFAFLTNLLAWLGLKGYRDLRFSDLVCYYKIENGSAKIQDWALSSSVGNFLTNGAIGLDGKLNLGLTTTLNKKESDLIKKYHGDWLFYFDKNGRAVIDIIVSGKFDAPQFKLDMAKVQDRLKGKIKDEWDKKKQDWEKKFKDLFK